MSSSSVASVWPSNDYAASEDIKEEGGRKEEGERVRVEMRCAIKDKVRSKESRWEGREEGTGKRRCKIGSDRPHVGRVVAYGRGNFMHSDLHHAAASAQSNFPAHFPD